jgi:hypothetical protein
LCRMRPFTATPYSAILLGSPGFGRIHTPFRYDSPRVFSSPVASAKDTRFRLIALIHSDPPQSTPCLHSPASSAKSMWIFALITRIRSDSVGFRPLSTLQSRHSPVSSPIHPFTHSPCHPPIPVSTEHRCLRFLANRGQFADSEPAQTGV